jgi:hypothetical protein
MLDPRTQGIADQGAKEPRFLGPARTMAQSERNHTMPLKSYACENNLSSTCEYRQPKVQLNAKSIAPNGHGAKKLYCRSSTS